MVASRQKDAYPTTVWRALPPPEKVVRWGSLAALGLAFFRRLPRKHSCWTHFTRTTPKTCRAHFVSLPAGAFGVAKRCHPLAPSRRARHQSANMKHQNEKLIAGVGKGRKSGASGPTWIKTLNFYRHCLNDTSCTDFALSPCHFEFAGQTGSKALALLLLQSRIVAGRSGAV